MAQRLRSCLVRLGFLVAAPAPREQEETSPYFISKEDKTNFPAFCACAELTCREACPFVSCCSPARHACCCCCCCAS